MTLQDLKDRQLFGGPILLQIEGDLSQPPAAWAADVRAVKLWEGLGAPQMGPPRLSGQNQADMVRMAQADALVLIVQEHLPSGMWRSTYWRLRRKPAP